MGCEAGRERRSRRAVNGVRGGPGEAIGSGGRGDKGGPGEAIGAHCVDLAKVQTQQGRLFFLILAVGCEWRVLVAQVTCGCRVLVAAVTQPTWQEITRHRLGSGAQLEKLKLNF